MSRNPQTIDQTVTWTNPIASTKGRGPGPWLEPPFAVNRIVSRYSSMRHTSPIKALYCFLVFQFGGLTKNSCVLWRNVCVHACVHVCVNKEANRYFLNNIQERKGLEESNQGKKVSCLVKDYFPMYVA